MKNPAIDRAASIFHVLGHAGRLELVVTLFDGGRSVSELAEQLQMTQPLVSQHLRTLRDVGLVAVTVSGRNRIYELADEHVRHVVADALVHSAEHLEQPESGAISS
ncbi:metalloregulator ArsR/SmtB family transcription factor [uncultured Gulosibacter sp.]|uniref:ArsR/SmtB family transcription factor n=1 Tax=uncultured Gulosibacter sp. TaxID=1339167 RepID=UPI00288C4845|nr:metalloregulator ArsR/SmtB family transcription factor [uncultured Gulosibacter sp.]